MMNLTSAELKKAFSDSSIVVVNDVIVKHWPVVIDLCRKDIRFRQVVEKRLNELKQFSGMKRYYFEMEA